MGRGPFAKMNTEQFEYRDDDPTTISEETREALKKSPYYFDLNKLKNDTFYMMGVQRARGYGKTHADLRRQSNGQKDPGSAKE